MLDHTAEGVRIASVAPHHQFDAQRLYVVLGAPAS